MVRIAIALLATVSVLLVSAGPAASGPLRKDGKVRACYKVKGKPKGALRILVRGKRCRRGERRVAWFGATPAAGAPGAPGHQGSTGASGSANEVALTAQVTALSQRVEGLEAILAGISATQLAETVALVPTVEILCEQASDMTDALNALNAGIEGIAILGNPLLSLDFASLPAPLGPFSCP